VSSTIEERFWAKVQPTGFCWEWTAGLNERGYGQFRIGPVKRKAHRVAYELLVSSIPDGLELDHLCRVRSCVNPDHLEPVTRAENNRRSFATIQAAAAIRARTHCVNGHPFDAANTAITKAGHRRCRACERKPSARPHSADRTHCPKGHPYDEANTYHSSGRRHCRTCRREEVRARRARRKALATVLGGNEG
jgi:hypothetical protein